MKKLILATLLSLNALAFARTTVPDDVSHTAADSQSNAIQNNYIWGQDQTSMDTPVNRRLVTDANGNLKVTGSTTATISGGVSVTNPASAAVQVAGTITNTAANAVQVAGSITNTVTVQGQVSISQVSPTVNVQGGVAITHVSPTVNVLGAVALNTISGTVATNYDKLTTGARTWGWVSLSSTALSGITTNANTTLSVTHVAGSSAYTSYWVKVGDVQGVTVMRVVGHDGITVPGTFAAGNGPQYFPSDNSKTIATFDKTGSRAPHVSFRAAALSGATSGTVWLEVWGQP